MDLHHIIIGAIVTEKAERLKALPRHTYTLKVAPKATKMQVKDALEQFFGVDVESVRVLRVQPKTRLMNEGTMEKRHSFKKALVTLGKDSKALDLAQFQSQS